jgi:hypothetical protein
MCEYRPTRQDALGSDFRGENIGTVDGYIGLSENLGTVLAQLL